MGKIYDVFNWANDHPCGKLSLFNLTSQNATNAFVANDPSIAWQYLTSSSLDITSRVTLFSHVSKDYQELLSSSQRWTFSKIKDITCSSPFGLAIMFFFFGECSLCRPPPAIEVAKEINFVKVADGGCLGH